MADRSAHASPRIFYGWFVVAGAFAVTFVGFGSAYTFSAFIGSLQQDFAASRGSVSLVFSVAGFLYFALGLVSGPLADRFGSRLLAVAGMILTGLGLAVASMARSLLEVYAAYGLGVGLGIGFSYVPILGAVQRWFVRRRGLASGLAVSGIGVGTLVMPPAAALLIGTIGWRGAYLVLGCFAATVGLGMALLVEDDPRRRGTGTDGDPPLVDAQTAQPAATGVREALRSPRFIGLCAASLLGSFGVFVPFVHLVPYAIDHGIPQSSAVLLMAVIGVGSTSGRFFLGGLADRLGRGLSLVVMVIGMALAFLLWAISASFGRWPPLRLRSGCSTAAGWPLMPAVVADYFGARNLGTLIGVISMCIAVGTLIGPSAAGFAFDLSRSYMVPIVASIGAYVIAAAILASASRPRPRAAL